jgi:hypothetical protein
MDTVHEKERTSMQKILLLIKLSIVSSPDDTQRKAVEPSFEAPSDC